MALLSAYETACAAEPSWTRGDAAGVCYEIRRRANDGLTFATARDGVFAREEIRARIAKVVDGGWLVRNPTLVWDAATMTGP